jgi:hypothetical protein
MQQALQHFLPAVFGPKLSVDLGYHLAHFTCTWVMSVDFMAVEPAATFRPFRWFDEPWQAWVFIAIRWIVGATILVAIMEELFWRDFVWRTILAPNDFKLAAIGEPDWKAFVGVALVFALVHGNWWLTSIVWALMISWLLVKTRSIGACIVAHATTNLLLGAYVLYTGDWTFW